MRLSIVALTVALAVTACGRHAPDTAPVTVLSGQCMGTTWSAKLVPAEMERTLDEVRQLIQGELDEVDRQLSTWKETTALSRLNAAAPGEPVPLEPLAVMAFRETDELVEATAGAFDPTVGALVKLWGFQRSALTQAAPTAEQIDGALAAVGWDKVELDHEGARRLSADVQVDLSAMAKGLAVDLAASVLDDLGAENYLMEVGGEMVLSGAIRDGASSFHIGIDDPLLPEGADPLSPLAHAPRPSIGRIAITDTAVATSGDYRNVRRVDGRIVAHAIDPRTGRPIDHALASITVLAPRCSRADALATAALVLGPVEGLALLESQQGVEGIALIRTGDPDAPLKLIRTSGAPEFEPNPNSSTEVAR